MEGIGIGKWSLLIKIKLRLKMILAWHVNYRCVPSPSYVNYIQAPFKRRCGCYKIFINTSNFVCQISFVSFVFEFFYFIASEVIDLLHRVQKVMYNNVMTLRSMNVVLTKIDFTIQKLNGTTCYHLTFYSCVIDSWYIIYMTFIFRIEGSNI